MLLTIFVFLVLFSLILIIGGKYVEAPVMQITGTAFLFVTGLLLMFSSVEYVSGTNHNSFYQYGDNFSNNPHWDEYSPDDNPSFSPSDDQVFIFHIYHNETFIYSSWDEDTILNIKTRHTVAFLLLMSAMLIFVSLMSQLREGIDNER